MKKTLLFLIAFVFLATFSRAQEQIPNGGFEDWQTHELLGFQYPVGWDNPNAVLSLFGLTPVMPSDDAAEGSKSAFLESKVLNAATDGEFVIPGVVTLGTFVVDYVNNTATLEGGIPFSSRPQALTGSYKNYPAAGDSTMVVAIFTKYLPAKGKRDTIGYGGMFSTETVDSWTNFTVMIYFNDTITTPDTMNVNVVSSNMINPNAESYMYIDNLAFEYELGISEPVSLLETKLFPNPAGETLNLQFERSVQAELSIFALEGRRVITTAVSGNEARVDVSQLPAGQYFFSLTENNIPLSNGSFMISK